MLANDGLGFGDFLLCGEGFSVSLGGHVAVAVRLRGPMCSIIKILSYMYMEELILESQFSTAICCCIITNCNARLYRFYCFGGGISFYVCYSVLLLTSALASALGGRMAETDLLNLTTQLLS